MWHKYQINVANRVITVKDENRSYRIETSSSSYRDDILFKAPDGSETYAYNLTFEGAMKVADMVIDEYRTAERRGMADVFSFADTTIRMMRKLFPESGE